jgi:beta-1,4-mannosyltransferase
MTNADCVRMKPLRVLSIPGRRHAQNSYFSLLWTALERSGIEMVEARTTAAIVFKFDLLHVHFPEHLITERPLYTAVLTTPIFLLYIAAARLFGKKLVWTIHEVYPTRRFWLAKPYLRCLRILANCYIFMNRTSEDEFFNQYPGERHKIICRIPHSSYPVREISTIRRRDVRRALTEGADCLLAGFLGEIRPYKNPSALHLLPATLPDGRRLHLVVAGRLHASCNVDEVETALGMIEPGRLVRIRERLSDEDLSETIQSIDLVFMPYLRGWNSGFAMFALGCGTRLLCSDLPMFREIENILGSPWIYLFDHNAPDLSYELTRVMERISRDKQSATDRDRLDQFLAGNSFERSASRHKELYNSIVHRKKSIGINR